MSIDPNDPENYELFQAFLKAAEEREIIIGPDMEEWGGWWHFFISGVKAKSEIVSKVKD
jgi:hypothetical protein